MPRRNRRQPVRFDTPVSYAPWEPVTPSRRRPAPRDIELAAALDDGTHALRAVPPAQGRAGAGLQQYANRIGRHHESVRQLRKAAEVLSKTSWKPELADKPSHLYEISKTPPDGAAQRLMPDNTKCPRCHPAYLNGAAAYAS
jgi:hypothetical protein